MKRKAGWLIIAMALLVAAAGVVYAHWQETLSIDASINTGSVSVLINAANTDDDGTLNGWDNVCLDNHSASEWDAWGTSSSSDPSSYCGSSGYATPRYTKDVGRCTVTSQGINGTVSIVQVENVYPSYHCTIRQTAWNAGSVPVKNQATRVWACGPGEDCSSFPTNFDALTYVRASDTFSYDSGDGDPDFELIMQHNPEGVCGSQFDPTANHNQFGSRVTFHVLQDAAQGSTYVLRFELVQVNWNEYSLANCVGFSNQPNP